MESQHCIASSGDIGEQSTTYAPRTNTSAAIRNGFANRIISTLCLGEHGGQGTISVVLMRQEQARIGRARRSAELILQNRLLCFCNLGSSRLVGAGAKLHNVAKIFLTCIAISAELGGTRRSI